MRSNPQRGTALLITMIVSTIILFVVMGLLSYASDVRTRAIKTSRQLTRASCAEAGLQFARAYYGRNFASWNTFLAAANTNIYNHPPTATAINPPKLDLLNAGFQTGAAAPLFVDLDNDAKPDVYLYIRDNQDETMPAADNPNWDNDQNVIVGAVCISTTMIPHMEQWQAVPTSLQTAEGFLSYNTPTAGCSQANCGNGTGNTN